MVAPLLATAIPIAGSLLGSIFGNKAAKKTNKLTQQELDNQRRMGDQQIKISDYIQNLSKELMAKGSTQVDPYGGTTGYDPTTGSYRSTLGAVPQQLQSASDAEELIRLVADQKLRRQGLNDFEGIRGRAAYESGNSLDDLTNFKRGIGAVDPAALAARIRLDRQGAVNAGFDDAERAAQTLRIRTGSSAVGDALSNLARDRVRAQAEIGSPEVEALQLAEGINTNRLGNLAGLYSSFADRGQNFYDADFTPAPYAGIADAKTADQMKFDLSKYEVGQGGSATAAAGIGSAAAGLRQAFANSEANRVKNPTGDLIAALTSSFGGAAKAFGI